LDAIYKELEFRSHFSSCVYKAYIVRLSFCTLMFQLLSADAKIKQNCSDNTSDTIPWIFWAGLSSDNKVWLL